MKNKKRTFWIISGALILMIGAGVWYGYHEFSRKTLSAGSLKADWTLTADTLVKQFASDQTKYTGLYTGKVLEISGRVGDIEGLPGGPVTVVLKEEKSDGSVRMVMDSTMNHAAASLKTGQQTSIRGICIGYTPDDLGLGADVLCNRSVIIKN